MAPFRQNLANVTTGAGGQQGIVGRGGNFQQLGAAAQNRANLLQRANSLTVGGGGQTPGVVAPPGIGGGDAGMSPSFAQPAINRGLSSAGMSWPGGPQSLASVSSPDVASGSAVPPPAVPGDMMLNGPAPGGDQMLNGPPPSAGAPQMIANPNNGQAGSGGGSTFSLPQPGAPSMGPVTNHPGVNVDGNPSGFGQMPTNPGAGGAAGGVGGAAPGPLPPAPPPAANPGMQAFQQAMQRRANVQPLPGQMPTKPMGNGPRNLSQVFRGMPKPVNPGPGGGGVMPSPGNPPRFPQNQGRGMPGGMPTY